MAVRRDAQLAQAIARAAEAERRQAEPEAKNAAARGSGASQAVPLMSLQIHSQTSARSHRWCTLAHRHQSDSQVRSVSAHRLLRRRKQQQPQNSSSSSVNSSKNALKREPVMLWCHCLRVLLLRQKRHRGQHHRSYRGCAAHGREKCSRGYRSRCRQRGSHGAEGPACCGAVGALVSQSSGSTSRRGERERVQERVASLWREK